MQGVLHRVLGVLHRVLGVVHSARRRSPTSTRGPGQVKKMFSAYPGDLDALEFVKKQQVVVLYNRWTFEETLFNPLRGYRWPRPRPPPGCPTHQETPLPCALQRTRVVHCWPRPSLPETIRPGPCPSDPLPAIHAAESVRHPALSYGRSPAPAPPELPELRGVQALPRRDVPRPLPVCPNRLGSLPLTLSVHLPTPPHLPGTLQSTPPEVKADLRPTPPPWSALCSPSHFPLHGRPAYVLTPHQPTCTPSPLCRPKPHRNNRPNGPCSSAISLSSGRSQRTYATWPTGLWPTKTRP